MPSLFPSLREYTARYGLTVAARRAAPEADTLVMHPGPMNRGVEIAAEVAEGPASLITEQVTNGVAVRMAVLYSLLGASVSEPGIPARSERPSGVGASVSEPGIPARSERPSGVGASVSEPGTSLG